MLAANQLHHRAYAFYAAKPKPTRSLLGGVEASEPPPTILTSADFHAPSRVQESLRLLRLGQHYERSGDLDNAYRCYQESHLVCPACEHGREAMQLLIDVEVQRASRSLRTGGSEGQEPPLKPLPQTPDAQDRLQTLLWYEIGW
jgi:hypothetical protein